MAFRTLGELRGILLARLGMGAMGASGGANSVSIDSFLSNGQFQLYMLQDWKDLTDYKDKTLGVGQNLLDYPVNGAMGSNGCARSKRVLRIERNINNQWMKLTEGIDTLDWDTMETQSWPEKFERYRQVLIYPKADTLYTVRIWFVQDLLPFTDSNHVATIDDEMILLHALANAKAHYRQPDAETYKGQLDGLLGTLRGQSFSSAGVYRRDDGRQTLQKPLVEGRDVP